LARAPATDGSAFDIVLHAAGILSYSIFGWLPIFAKSDLRYRFIVDADESDSAMGLRPLWIHGLFVLVTLAQAQEIHKCAGQDGISYQNIPCASGRQEQVFASNARNESRQEQAPASATRNENARVAYSARSREANHYAGTPFAATTLFIGMTDTQVLNLPSWGRPAQILRSKARQGWREEWVYKNQTDEWHMLYFENGRLVTREEAPAPSMQARISSEQDLPR